jgi:uncharacterized protein (TIGR02145 family)
MKLTSDTTNVPENEPKTIDFAWSTFENASGTHNGSFVTGGYLTTDGSYSTSGVKIDAWRQVNSTDPNMSNSTNCINNTSTDGNNGNISYNTNSKTGCGYLYNFYTATASTAPNTQISGEATGSICPAGWKLPSGQDKNGDYGNLDFRYGGAGSYHNGDVISQGLWLSAGAWQGAFSGFYNSGLSYQGSSGYYWSSSVDSAVNAYYTYFNSSFVSPGTSLGGRNNGVAVRCLADENYTVPTTPTVEFDGVAATNISVTNNEDGTQTITATTPAHSSGTVNVVVDNGVDPPVTMENAYNYTNIIIDSIIPNHGVESGGTTVTITGSGFIDPTPPSKPETMQQMTAEYCADQMETYTNTGDDDKLLRLTDVRNGQDYLVGKLADGRCWMLNNLKIADYHATADDTDLKTYDWRSGQWISSGEFDIPDLSTTFDADSWNPKVYGPVPSQSDDITSDTFYGYLYNWQTAVANDYNSSDGGIKKNSICPAGWNLPTANTYYVYQSDYSNLYDKLGVDGLGFSGAFRGVFSGSRSSVFSGQDETAYLWSASYIFLVEGGDLDNVAANFVFNANSATDVSMDGRVAGMAVRCLASSDPTTPPPPTVTLDTGSDTVKAAVTAWDDKNITITTPAHDPGLVSITINNGVDSVTLPATCDSATATACNGQLDSGEARNDDRSHISSGFLYEEEYVSLAAPSPNLDVAGNSSNFTTGAVTNQTSLTAYTNALAGYSLDLASKSGSSDLASPNGDRITGIDGTLANPASLDVGTWGFAIGLYRGGLVGNKFSPVATYQSAVSGDQNALTQAKWAKLPASSSSSLTIKQTYLASEAGDSTEIYYGVKTDITQPGGTYSNTVVYTVVGNI